MKKVFLFGAVVGTLFASSALQAEVNLVQDPGFEGSESGTLGFSSVPWYSISGGNVAINSANPESGNFSAILTTVGSESATMLQNITLTVGPSYDVSFGLSALGFGGTLNVDLNGILVTTLNVASGTPYTDYSLTATPLNATGPLVFSWLGQSSGTSVAVDNVSVTAVPVPEPTTMVAGALMILPFAASTFRRRKKALNH